MAPITWRLENIIHALHAFSSLLKDEKKNRVSPPGASHDDKKLESLKNSLAEQLPSLVAELDALTSSPP